MSAATKAFKERALVTLENLSPDNVEGFYYQIDHTLTEVEADRAYFHAQWRRANPLPYRKKEPLLATKVLPATEKGNLKKQSGSI